MKIYRLMVAAATMLLVAVQSKAEVEVHDKADIPFASYEKYSNEAFGLDLQMPKGFVDGRRMCSYRPASSGGGTGITWAVGAMLQSSDKQCAVLMPDMMWRGHDLAADAVGDVNDFVQCEVYWSVKGALWHEYLVNHPAISMAKYEKRLAASKFNADTAVLVTLPANDTIMGQRYVTRNLLILKKADRPVVLVDLFFTDKGAKNKDKYFAEVWEAVKYAKNPGWHYDASLASKLRQEHLKNYVDNYFFLR